MLREVGFRSDDPEVDASAFCAPTIAPDAGFIPMVCMGCSQPTLRFEGPRVLRYATDTGKERLRLTVRYGDVKAVVRGDVATISGGACRGTISLSAIALSRRDAGAAEGTRPLIIGAERFTVRSKMTTPSASASRLADALRALHPGRLATIEALRPLYCADVDFRDPIQHVHGIEAFIAMNYRLLKRARDLAFVVTSAVGEGDTIFLAWTMTAVPKLGPRIVVDGATHATLRDGKVAVHRDFWDLGELFTSPIPFGHAALQLLLKPLA